jgi:hypothetical protein
MSRRDVRKNASRSYNSHVWIERFTESHALKTGRAAPGAARHGGAAELGERSIVRRGVVCRVSNPHPLKAGGEALPLSHV